MVRVETDSAAPPWTAEVSSRRPRRPYARRASADPRLPHPLSCRAWMPGSRTRAEARQEKTAGCCVCREDSAVFFVSTDETAPGELPGHLRSLGGSAKSLGMMVSHVRRGALTAHFGVRGARPRRNCWAWMPGSRTRAEARQANIGRMPMVRVETEPALVLRCWKPTQGRLHDRMPALGFQARSLSPVATRFHLVDSAR